MADKKVREELSGLTAELARLREEIAALRAAQAAHHCHGGCFGHGHCNWGHCCCYITHSYSPSLPPSYSPYWTVTTWTAPATSGGSGSLAGTMTQSASGYPVEGFTVTNGVVTGSGYTVSASN